MAELPSISVVIPSYRSGPLLPAALDALQGQRYDGVVQIVVVRTGPDDGADHAVRSRSGVRLLCRDERAFAGAARNLGAEAATGELLAFLDADCVPGEEWLLSMATAYQLGSRAQGGAIETHPPKTISARAEEFLETLEFHPRGSARPLEFASAANSAYDAELFRSVGGFADVKLGEDLLLGRRLIERGIPISFNPAMNVLHRNDVSLRRFLAKQREHGIYSARVRRKSGLRGSVLVRRRWLAPLAGPARLVRLPVRAGQVSPSLLPHAALLAPLLTLGVAAWTFGFVRGTAPDPSEVTHE